MRRGQYFQLEALRDSVSTFRNGRPHALHRGDTCDTLKPGRGAPSRCRDLCERNISTYSDAGTLRHQPMIMRLQIERIRRAAQRDALHEFLYDRPVPVEDATMLTHSIKT